ncbi:MAG: hypothetical protein R3F62_30070 [Planctomycetota bacterium]
MDPSSFTSSSEGPYRGALRASQGVVFASLALTAVCVWFANAAVAGIRRDSLPERALFARLREPRPYAAVVLGSSRAKYGIDPGVLGEDCCSLALPGAAARMNRVMAEYFLDRGNHAQLVLLEVSPRTFDPAKLWRRVRDDVLSLGVEPALELQRRVYGEPSWGQLGQLVVQGVPLWGEAAPPELVLLGVDYWDPRLGPAATGEVDPVTGFAPLPAAIEAIPAEPVTAPAILDPAELAGFAALIERFQATGTQVVLVETPVLAAPEVDPFPAFAAAVQAQAEAHGLVHLDWRAGPLAATFERTPERFYDATHLSRAGAEAFSQALRAELERRGLWPPGN